MIDMTKAEVLDIWRGFVKHMTDEGAVFPFANEIARLTRNEMLDRLEEAEEEKERLLGLAHDQNNELIRLREECRALRARIVEMELQEPVRHEFQGRDGTWRTFIDQRHYENTVADGSWPIRALYLAPGAQPAPSINPASLYAVINWLRNGCDPSKAADELEMFAAKLED